MPAYISLVLGTERCACARCINATQGTPVFLAALLPGTLTGMQRGAYARRGAQAGLEPGCGSGSDDGIAGIAVALTAADDVSVAVVACVVRGVIG